MKQTILLAILFSFFVSYVFSQEKVSREDITLRYSGCKYGLAVFVLENRSKQNIFARVQSMSYRAEWKKADAQYGVFISEYKALPTDTFTDVSDIFDAPFKFTIIRPNMKIRYGIPLRNGSGIYRVSVPYIGNLKMKKTADNFANSSAEDIERIVWEKVSSKESFIPCK